MANIIGPEDDSVSTLGAWAPSLSNIDDSAVFPWEALYEYSGGSPGGGASGPALQLVDGAFVYGAAIGPGARLVAFET